MGPSDPSVFNAIGVSVDGPIASVSWRARVAGGSALEGVDCAADSGAAGLDCSRAISCDRRDGWFAGKDSWGAVDDIRDVSSCGWSDDGSVRISTGVILRPAPSVSGAVGCCEDELALAVAVEGCSDEVTMLS